MARVELSRVELFFIDSSSGNSGPAAGRVAKLINIRPERHLNGKEGAQTKRPTDKTSHDKTSHNKKSHGTTHPMHGTPCPMRQNIPCTLHKTSYRTKRPAGQNVLQINVCFSPWECEESRIMFYHMRCFHISFSPSFLLHQLFFCSFFPPSHLSLQYISSTFQYSTFPSWGTFLLFKLKFKFKFKFKLIPRI